MDLRWGKSVSVYTSDFLEEIEQDPQFLIWRENYFIQWFAVPYREELIGRTVYFIDGKIDDPILYSFLKETAEDQGVFSFNPEQYAVEHAPLDQHQFVVAGAGTGKTTVMVNRLLYLKHVDPTFRFEQAAMITFTNEAATLIRKRLHKQLRSYYHLTLDQKYFHWLDEAKDLHISTSFLCQRSV